MTSRNVSTLLTEERTMISDYLQGFFAALALAGFIINLILFLKNR